MSGLIDENQENVLEEAVQRFIDARLQGQEPDIDEFVKKYPDFKHQLRQKILNLQKIDTLFDSLVQADESDYEDAVAGQELVGSQIGHYKLLSVLSEGGMGIVYSAEQKHPIRRRVALKVIKPGMDSARVIARFESERQALALMDHPNIAQVYDAGTTESGRPYFAMEYVKGVPITEHCDRHKLTIEERLKLFLQVCDAVQHAHQKGIIHRDIKPTNIIVSIEVDKSIPKIIDFGVAKALSQPLTERTLVTEHGQMLGTPEYMSPEQAEMTGEDIDTRSDIYSLGILLYELLTGVLPFETEALRKGGVIHVRRMICEEEPKTPSTRLSRLSREKTTELAKSRRAEPGALKRRLRGDLDWITLKAMEKDRTRRYTSVGEFGADIIRHLNNEPVVAGPPSTVYRLKKFVRRHKALVTGIAAVLAVMTAGVVISTIFAIRAERQANIAQAVADFLQNGIEALTLPGQAKGTEVSLHDLLTVWSKKLEGSFDDKPLIEASIRDTLGWAYRYISEPKAAEPHLERALQIRQEQLGLEHPQTLKSVHRLTFLRWDQGRYADGVVGLAEEALSKSRRSLGEEHHVTLSLTNALGVGYIGTGCFNEAEQLYLRGLQAARRAKSNAILWLLFNLGRVYAAQGRYDEAKLQYDECLTLKESTSDNYDSYTNTTIIKGFLAQMYIDQKRYTEAKELLLEIVPMQRSEVGTQHWHTLRSANWLAQVHMHLDEHDEAETLLMEVLDARKLKLRKDHPLTLGTINDLGVLRREQKRYEEAEFLLKQAIDGRQRELGDDHPHTLESMHELAILYKEQGDYDKAEQLLLLAVKGRHLKLGDTHPHTLQSLNNLIDLYEAWNKPEKAAHWRAKLPSNQATEQ